MWKVCYVKSATSSLNLSNFLYVNMLKVVVCKKRHVVSIVIISSARPLSQPNKQFAKIIGLFDVRSSFCVIFLLRTDARDYKTGIPRYKKLVGILGFFYSSVPANRMIDRRSFETE
jgi:hypothetical protein